MPTLYVVATPIGNLEDISLRALRVLKEVGLIAAEDTRTTRHLLNTYQITTPLTSYHEHNKAKKLTVLLRALEQTDVALVSEAGMPTVSDPGYELVNAALEMGARVEALPGASALVTALAVSGLPSSQFHFLGFLPRRSGQRQRLLKAMASETCTLVAFEAPHRVVASLKDLLSTLGDRRIAVCRELTKLHEEVFRGSISEAMRHFREPRGEFTLVVEGAAFSKAQETHPDITAVLLEKRRLGMAAREAVAQVASETGLSKRTVYRAWLELVRKEAPIS